MYADLVFQGLGGLLILAVVAWAGWRWRSPSVAPAVTAAEPSRRPAAPLPRPGGYPSLFHPRENNEEPLDEAPVPQPARCLDVDMRLVDEDAIRTYEAISRNVGALLRAGKVERTPEVEEIVSNITALTVYALGTRKYRKGGTH